MSGGISIGYHDKGLFQLRRQVEATPTGVRNVSYPEALAATRRTSGPDLIVAREQGGTYTYDVLDVTAKTRIRDRAIPANVASERAHIKLVDDVPRTVNGSDAFLVNESNQTEVLVGQAHQSDKGIGRRAVDHARRRDVEGAIALTAGITSSAVRQPLNETFTRLRTAKQDLEQTESRLRGELSTAEQALATKRAPYDQALSAAEQNLRQVSSHHAGIVSGKARELREAQTPGIHQAESDVRARQSERDDAQRALSSARGRLDAARATLARADQLRAEIDAIPYKTQTVHRKLADYAEAQRDHDIAMRQYQSELRRYEEALREYERASQYQNQPSGSQYQNAPSDSQYQNQPSGSQYQNAPSGSQYQNQPSGSQYQNGPAPHRPVRPTEPELRRPSSWSWGDSEYSLRSELRTLERRAIELTSEESRVRSDGFRQQDAAHEAIRSAESQLGRAEARLDAATDRLRSLPPGNPATIRTAERNLEAARTAQTNALRPAQARVDEAREALQTNTKQERETVTRLQGELEAAPNAFQTAIDEAARRAGL